MILGVIEWVWERRGDISLNAAVTYIVFRVTLPYLMKHYRLDPDEDRIQWLIETVQEDTGKKYVGATQRYSRKARTSYRRLLKLLLAAVRRGYRLRRRKGMQINYVSLVVALLGALKLILEPYGITIEDEQINAISNGLAAIVTIIGVVLSHRKPQKPQHPWEGDVANGHTESAATFESHR
jgi:uncharacterized membrane protein